LPFVYERLDRFHFSPEEARTIWPIVANAGLYNSFIAAGLVWSLYTTRDSQSIKVFFLTCVVIAGIVGAPTVSWLTIVIQTLPALLALLLLRVSNKET
jgi:putative membrane protein